MSMEPDLPLFPFAEPKPRDSRLRRRLNEPVSPWPAPHNPAQIRAERLERANSTVQKYLAKSHGTQAKLDGTHQQPKEVAQVAATPEVAQRMGGVERIKKESHARRAPGEVGVGAGGEGVAAPSSTVRTGAATVDRKGRRTGVAADWRRDDKAPRAPRIAQDVVATWQAVQVELAKRAPGGGRIGLQARAKGLVEGVLSAAPPGATLDTLDRLACGVLRWARQAGWPAWQPRTGAWQRRVARVWAMGLAALKRCRGYVASLIEKLEAEDAEKRRGKVWAEPVPVAG